MILEKINGEQFKKIVTSGALNLREHFEEVDSLNVFPVPDGDTGTNMLRTIEGGAKAIAKVKNNLPDISKELTKAMLMSARGNSGVILSQIFRGICKGLEKYSEVDALQLVKAYQFGVKQAYGAVVTPVEGTILTVFREATEAAAEAVTKESTINDFYEAHLKQALVSLQKTQEILPVLTEAGVIDSGGAGYVYIVKGIVKYLDGEEFEAQLEQESASPATSGEIDFNAFTRDDELEFGYCTEFILRLQSKKVDIDSFDVNTIIEELNGDDIKGESIVALKDDDVVKVHVHTKEPGIVLHKMRKYGEFLATKIENMALQHNENMAEKEEKPEHKKYAIVAVGQGEGLVEQFKQFGVDVVVSGNQTMNPSTEDFIKAFDKLDAENIIVFPNNKNIVMAAKQAQAIYKKAHVVITNSVTIPQCYSALTMLDYSSDDLTIILGNFNEAIRNVVTGEITVANRATKLNGVAINKDDHICIVDGKIKCATTEEDKLILHLLETLGDADEKEVLTVLVGKDVSDEEVEKNVEAVQAKYPYMDVGVIKAGQAVYKFLLAIE